MTVEVFSLVTAKIDSNFLTEMASCIGQDDCITEKLLSGMSSNLKCWQTEDHSWYMSGCLNNIVEAGANLLSLYMRWKTAARDNLDVDVSFALASSSAGFTSPLTKIEELDGEGDLQDQDSRRKTSPRQSAVRLQSGTGAEEMDESEDDAVPRRRLPTRQAAHRQIYNKREFGCRTCKKSFSSATNLRRHVRANHESGRFQCQYCPLEFRRCDSLLRHRRTAHADLQCNSCRKVFKNVDSKSSHVCKGRSRDKLLCNVCRKSFISRSNLNKHIRMTHAATAFTCQDCGKIFRQSDSLTLHTWKNHRRFICPHCGSVHETADLLCKHMSTVHGKKLPSMSPNKHSPRLQNGDESFDMNDASDGNDDNDAGGTAFPDANEDDDKTLLELATNGETSLLDEVPDSADHLPRGTSAVRKIRSKALIGKHRAASGVGTGEHSGSKTNACHICSKCFSSESNLRRHIRVNHEATRFPCQECTLVFKRIDSLVRHKRANHAELCCSVCRGVFNSVEAKESHDCTRPSEKKLSCDICGKSFANRSNVNKHSYLVHGGVKFHCTECPKFFRRSMTLTLHMWKFHNQFTCPQCNSVLESAALLCEHMTVIHGRKATKNLSEICRRPASRPKPIANCIHCNKMFSSRSNLSKHIRIVHGHPRFHCTMCERTFTSELMLSLHIRTFHQHLPMKLVPLGFDLFLLHYITTHFAHPVRHYTCCLSSTPHLAHPMLSCCPFKEHMLSRCPHRSVTESIT